jgi:adenylate isopentenyltransferase (cytokinin synthase)
MESKGMNGQSPKPKVVFVLGATATGKSKLAIALAQQFDGEVINADKIQMYDGVPVITNKVTEEECAGVPHHLLGGVHPDADFTAEDFCREASAAIARILAAGRLPIVAGGSNTYIEALVEGDNAAFRAAYDCLFIWLDATPELLEWYTALRVDDMVQRGLAHEARAVFDAGNADYSRGVRRAIGLPEMHDYLLLLELTERQGAVAEAVDLAERFDHAVRQIKANTFGLVLAQQAKIQRLSGMEGWDVRRVDATIVFACMAAGLGQEAWETVVWEPCQEMVKRFLETQTFIPDAADKLPSDLELDEEMAKVFVGFTISPDAAGDAVLALPAVHKDKEAAKGAAPGEGDGDGGNAGIGEAGPDAAGGEGSHAV